MILFFFYYNFLFMYYVRIFLLSFVISYFNFGELWFFLGFSTFFFFGLLNLLMIISFVFTF